MHSDSVATSAEDSRMWPAYNQSKAREVLRDPLSPTALKQFCILLLGNMHRERALTAAAILLAHEHEQDGYHYGTHKLRQSLRQMAKDKGVWV